MPCWGSNMTLTPVSLQGFRPLEPFLSAAYTPAPRPAQFRELGREGACVLGDCRKGLGPIRRLPPDGARVGQAGRGRERFLNVQTLEPFLGAIMFQLSTFSSKRRVWSSQALTFSPPPSASPPLSLPPSLPLSPSLSFSLSLSLSLSLSVPQCRSRRRRRTQ